jgi:hypothetical protein
MGATEESSIFVLGNLASLARVACKRNDLERAALLWGVVCAEGERLPAWDERREALSDGELDDVATGNSFQRGRALDLWAGAAIALGEDEADQTVP